MRAIQIPKKNGKFRTVYLPSNEEKLELRMMLGSIARKAEKLGPRNVAHGFTRGKNPVTNAVAHIGYKYSLSFDLKDFFDTVTEKQLNGLLTQNQLSKVLVEGAARQGLPTSPAVANLAAISMDEAILEMLNKKKIQAVYTRYADDLTFSFNEPETRIVLLKEIPQIVGRCGFKINKEKTHFQAASAGRRIITGVAIDDKAYPTRKLKRKLRAAYHRGKRPQIHGLREAIKVKLPNPKRHENYDELLRLWKLPRLKECDLMVDKGPDEILTPDIIITGDVAYTLGMSTFTTGWASCLKQPEGKHRRSVLFWLRLKGTKIAAYLSDRTTVFGGIERRVMRARCLVHTLRNGVRIYDRIYGNYDDCITLRNTLEEAGVMSISKARESGYEGEKVVGNAPVGYKTYADSLRIVKVRPTESKRTVNVAKL